MADWPMIRTVGIDRMLVSFGPSLSEPANRAALALRAAIEAEAWDGVLETTTSLVSACVVFDPLRLAHTELQARLAALVHGRDWMADALPAGRTLWRVPTVFGGDLAPQLEDAARAAGLSKDSAIASLSAAPVRVQTIGFAPGMPYLGQLPEVWDIPRQQGLTPMLPVGALAVALRQLVLFPVDTPTGWRQVGQTAIQLFQPEAERPFVLNPGDEVLFVPTDAQTLGTLRDDPMGGAVSEAIA